MNAIIKTDGKFNLYKSQDNNLFELWIGDKNTEESALVGYVGDIENFEEAVDNANEELAYLAAEAVA
jgi:hypothetical protein